MLFHNYKNSLKGVVNGMESISLYDKSFQVKEFHWFL